MVAQQSSLALNNSPKQITLKEYWGPLVLIIVGILASIIAAIAETMYFKYKGRVSTNASFELLFAGEEILGIFQK